MQTLEDSTEKVTLVARASAWVVLRRARVIHRHRHSSPQLHSFTIIIMNVITCPSFYNQNRIINHFIGQSLKTFWAVINKRCEACSLFNLHT